ncbi:hypothetical protein BO94DRAFT_538418 [Aspergillus sclerotioniger CBS 115572]|uniref:Uncharacterized protein n=1 Tax=Aspergillus sclerotioniger CBS 115572 TaxID=1450535 RepID=A0A317VNS9_9EURO|nr:hypothetical protein BO94DRAFT_538418 [Aspergillus sclerotioniger CBS 115572]PWY75986.1 hypothetical protein BO94DRAFT_538418 [Aspergillus sclerotioniger CBS 115572]
MPSTKGGTTQDGHDMWRVGRDQELNVGGRPPLVLPSLTGPAQLSIPLGAGLQCRVDVHLGGRPLVRGIDPD